MGTMNNAAKEKLISQIGKYPNPTRTTTIEIEGQQQEYDVEIGNCLSEQGKKELYKGISQYELTHRRMVSAYKQAHDMPEDAFALNDPKFFRKQLIEYIAQRQLPKYQPESNQDTRKTNPEGANITLENLLGPEGVELYKLALEEEMKSREFRDATVKNATSHFEGPKWKERPVVIVAGPSACGKSYAAEHAVKTANRFLPTDEQNQSGNNVVAVDGGVVRETSQMRKLLIQIAIHQGYTGVDDLHSKSKTLEGVKKHMQAAAFATPDAGVVIPETFSKIHHLLHPVKNLIYKIAALVNTRQIFTRVTGENAANFQDTVGFMGSRRAWQTQEFDTEPFDLNKTVDVHGTPLCESKAYDPDGFRLGQLGSWLAEKLFNALSKEKLSMIITNDLVLLKPNPTAPKGPWLPAEQNDEGVKLISKSVYNQWLELPEVESKPSLTVYHKENAQPIISTSAQIDFAIAQKHINKRLAKTEEKLEKELQKNEPNPDRVAQLINRKALLSTIAHFDPRDLSDPAAITQLKTKTENAIANLRETKEWRPLSVSWTINAFNKALTAIENTEEELKKHKEQFNASTVNNCQSLKSRLQEIKRTGSVEESLEDQQRVRTAPN